MFGAAALVATSASLAGCALSSNSSVTFGTNAKVPETASRPQSDPHFGTRFDQVASRILDDASMVPSYRRQITRAKATETEGFSLPLKGGGLIFMEVKAPADQRPRGRHGLDARRAVEIYVEQQGTRGGARNFGLDITNQHSRFNASCQHGKDAVVEFDSGNTIEAVYDVGRKNRDYHNGQGAANRLLDRILNSASHEVNTTNARMHRLAPHENACQNITVATFGATFRGPD